MIVVHVLYGYYCLRIGILCTDSYEEVMKIASDPVVMRKEGFVVQKYLGAFQVVFDFEHISVIRRSYSTRTHVYMSCTIRVYSVLGLLLRATLIG